VKVLVIQVLSCFGVRLAVHHRVARWIHLLFISTTLDLILRVIGCPGVPISSSDIINLKLFPFSLRGKAKDWLLSLPKNSID
jgi:hypothetical protein